MYFLCDHALAFYNGLTFLQFTDLLYLLERIFSIFCPNNFGATLCYSCFKCFEGLIKHFNCTQFQILGLFTSQAYITELLFALWNYSIVFSYIKIDLAAMFFIGRFFGALYRERG